MSDEPGGSLDLGEVERELCRIPEVQAVRIVADAEGTPLEVHVVATPAKHAKQLARDIQSVAMASFGLDVDRRVISIVQLDDGQGHWVTADDELVDLSDAGRGRVVVAGVLVEPIGHRARARVTLQRGEEVAVGTAEGSSAPTMVVRLVAEAGLDALRELEPAAVRADVEAASVVQVGTRMVAVVAVVLVVPPYEEIVSGSAVVRPIGPNEAVVRALLAATNRRLPALA